MTITAPIGDVVGIPPDVYQSAGDSRLLIDALRQLVVIRADTW
ncbi:hypothetical protein [Mycobacterium antarcticum]|nr:MULTISPECIES: hypothetical protein [unclassified Mycolicibacterium]